MKEKIIQVGTNKIYSNSVGNGNPLIICDGLGCNGFVWEHLRPFLAEKYNTIYWNYIGHGKSTLSKHRPDYYSPTHYLLKLMDAYCINKCILCGFSMGTQVALDMAIHNPNMVEAIISICGTYGAPLNFLNNSDAIAKVLPYVQSMIESMPDSLLKSFWKHFTKSKTIYYIATLIEGNTDAAKSGLIPYFENIAGMDPRAFVWTLEACQKNNLEQLLQYVKQPTLLLSGEKDSLSPPSVSKTMKSKIPNAQLSIMPACTHIAPLESPEFVQLRIEKFLKENNL